MFTRTWILIRSNFCRECGYLQRTTMSSLASRASSVKNSDDSKKSSEIKYTVLNLPATNVFAVEPKDFEANQALQTFKNEYSTAKGVDQQLSAVNKLMVHFNSIDPWILDEKILAQILADLYFNAPPKHPLRGILAKALHKKAAKKRELITECVTRTIIESNGVIQAKLQQNQFDADGVRSFVSSLYGCFENFEEATAAIKSCLPILLQSLRQFIDIFIKKLQNDSSPARRSEVFIDLHNTIRVLVGSVQLFGNSIRDKSLLEPILTQCWSELLDNPIYADSPVDTKINCAILKVNYDRSFGDIFEPRSKILTQFTTSEKVSSLKWTNVLPKEIYYAIAVMNTIVEKDLSNPNYFPALRAIVDRLISVGNEFTKDPCLIMAVTRALVACSKKLLSHLRKVSLDENDVTVNYLREAVKECLAFVWINFHHSVDCVRYLSKDLLKNVLKLGQEHPQMFGDVVNETVSIAKSNSTSETLVCLLLDYLSQVFTTEYVLNEMPDIQQRILRNIFSSDSCWATCYEQLLLKNSEINLDKWCERWIDPLILVDPLEWKNDFDRLKIIRKLFERALKTRPEAAEYILADTNISIEIYLFVLWIMRRSGRKLYAPENFRVSADQKVIYAKVHPSDEIRILAFRILIECHKQSATFANEDLNEILEFFRFNCNVQNPAMRQQMNTTFKRAMNRIECGYCTAKRKQTEENSELCRNYEAFLRNLIEFSVDWCLFDGANFGRRSVGLTTLLYSVKTWQKILPENTTIYTDKLWIRLQTVLSDTYVNNKDVASDILLLCWKFYPNKTNLIYTLDDLKKFITTFRPYDVMTAAHYLVFSAFSETHFESYYNAILWCEAILDDGLAAAKKSLLHTARYNALYGVVLAIRQLLKRIDFSNISDNVIDIANWRSFFQRIIIKSKELTDVAAPIVNNSAPEGHLPNDLNDVSHYVDIPDEENDNGSKIKVTAQMILICSWRTVRETALLLGEIALRIPILTTSNPNGLITVDQLLQMCGHFQQLLVETKHRGAFEQSFLGFQSLCLRLWRSHEPQLHLYPMKLVEKIAKVISGECSGNESDAEFDVKKLCATRRSAGIPFMVQGVVTTETQVCSSSALHFCITTFLDIAKTGSVNESRTHSLNILRALFKCTELGEAVSEYISDAIECSIRGYSANSWPERNSSTLLFSALMVRVFGVPHLKVSENVSIKNKMTGRLFFMRYPRLYDFFYVELKSASEAIERNERPTRLHPLLLLINRLYPSAREGTESNLRLSTYIPFISTCSSSPELVTRQHSAKSIVALIPLANTAERLSFILGEISTQSSLNTIHGYMLQVLYLLRSTKQENYEIDIQSLKAFTTKFVQLKLPVNNIIAKTYLEILLEILLTERFHPIDTELLHQLIEVRDKFVTNFAHGNQYGQLTHSYSQKSFTQFNLLLSANVENEASIISISVLNTQNELIETQLNIKYLFLCRPNQEIIESSNEYSRYEIEFFKFFRSTEHRNIEAILRLLPSIKDLYHIIENKRKYYPFRLIKAYEILSLLIAPVDAFEKMPDLKRLSIVDLIEIMDAIDGEGVDDVEEAMWKFVAAHLHHCQIQPSQVTNKQIQRIIEHLRKSTQSYRLSSLRQTITEVLAIIIQYFEQCSHLEVIIDAAELFLSLLRDDDLCVRNRISEIVMDLVHFKSKESVDKVIPLAAEEHLLQWLDSRFVQIAENNVWSNWLDLLRLVFAPVVKNQEENTAANDSSNDNNLVDVEIFDESDANTFGETIYTSYKCYTFMVKHINGAQLDVNQKQEILSEFKILQNI